MIQHSLEVIESDDAGLRCCIFTPEIVEKKSSELPKLSSTYSIKIAFRGTASIDGGIRDLEFVPGETSFYRHVCRILEKVEEILDRCEFPIGISCYGHSLGGADAQCCFTNILQKLSAASEKPNSIWHKVDSLALRVFNSAGIASTTNTSANAFIDTLKQTELGKKININLAFLHAAGDLVQQTGETTVLNDVNPANAQIFLVKAKGEEKLLYVYSAINPMRLYQAFHALKNVMTAHTSQYFTDYKKLDLGAINTKFEFYTNQNSGHSDIIKRKLTNKMQVIQATAVRFMQKMLFVTTKVGSVIYDSVASDQFPVIVTGVPEKERVAEPSVSPVMTEERSKARADSDELQLIDYPTLFVKKIKESFAQVNENTTFTVVNSKYSIDISDIISHQAYIGAIQNVQLICAPDDIKNATASEKEHSSNENIHTFSVLVMMDIIFDIMKQKVTLLLREDVDLKLQDDDVNVVEKYLDEMVKTYQTEGVVSGSNIEVLLQTHINNIKQLIQAQRADISAKVVSPDAGSSNGASLSGTPADLNNAFGSRNQLWRNTSATTGRLIDSDGDHEAAEQQQFPKRSNTLLLVISVFAIVVAAIGFGLVALSFATFLSAAIAAVVIPYVTIKSMLLLGTSLAVIGSITAASTVDGGVEPQIDHKNNGDKPGKLAELFANTELLPISPNVIGLATKPNPEGGAVNQTQYEFKS